MKSNPIIKTINQRSSGQGLIQSILPVSGLLFCSGCKEKYDSQHYPYLLCKNFHVLCKKCVDNLIFVRNDNKSPPKSTQKKCPQCSEKITPQIFRPFTTYYQLCQYIRKMQETSKKQQMRYQLKQLQSQQVIKMMKKQNLQLKKWIKQVSQKLRQIQVNKKWTNSKNNDFVFELPGSEVKNLQFEVIDGIIKKNCVGSFANIVGLQPIPKNGVYSFTIKLVSSLSGGSLLYGLCSIEAKQQKFPWLTQYFIGYSGNDGDVISSGSWSNATTLYYDGTKVRAGDQLTTIIDMNNKIICWKINDESVSDSFVIPHQIRNKLLFPIIVLQDGDRLQIIQNRPK